MTVQNKNPKLIIVNGLPASGKTTLAEFLSEDLGIPMFNKDGFKEMLSDTMKVSSIKSSRRLDNPSLILLLKIAKTLLARKISVIIESNFKLQKDLEEFANQMKENGVTIIEIFCRADGSVLVERFRERMETRHSIHPRIMPAKFVRELRLNKLSPLGVGKTLIVDTTVFAEIPYNKVIAFVKE